MHKWAGPRVPKATQAIATVGWTQILVFTDRFSDDESKYMYRPMESRYKQI
jgi:hypothetical protein